YLVGAKYCLPISRVGRRARLGLLGWKSWDAALYSQRQTRSCRSGQRKLKPMSYLITGGSGCIGSYLIRDLLASGKKVVNYDFNPQQHILKQVVAPEALSEIVSVTGDVTDLPQLLRTIKEQQVEQIIHLASLQIPAS